MGGEDVHRALYDVSVALFAVCFPLPSLSFAFYSRGISFPCLLLQKQRKARTEKSAAFAFCFFVTFGAIVECLLIYWMRDEMAEEGGC